MGKKIAKIDADAMNSLYASEFGKLAGHKVADKDAKEVEGYRSFDPQAFKDHKEYLETLKSAMSADEKSGGDPNDPVLD
jgi:hypothetical protein